MNKKTRPKPRLSRYSWLEVALDLLFIVKEADRIRLDFIRDQFERMGFLGLDLENRSRLFMRAKNTTAKYLFQSMILLGFFILSVSAVAKEKPPNIVIIWGDDIGQSNVSAYSMGLMGYQTPTSIVLPGKE